MDRSHHGFGASASSIHPINLVKVFSASKSKDREAIGEQVTGWIAANPTARIVKTSVVQSSDEEFHCYSIVLFCFASVDSSRATS
jgi:hypothetical protein